MFSNSEKLKPYIIYSNIIFTLGPILSHYIFPSYTYQNELLISAYNPFYYSVSYDGAHFLTNKYHWEKNYAFLPGFTMLTRILCSIFSPTISIICILLINKIATAYSSIVLRNLIFKFTSNQKVSLLAGVFFIFNPASIFFHACYSEAVYSLVIFSAVYTAIQALESNQSIIDDPYLFLKNNTVPLTLFGFSIIFRTTGIFMTMIYGVPILKSLIKLAFKFQIVKAIKTAITGAIVLSFFLVFMAGYLYIAFKKFCRNGQHADFCDKLIPNIYSDVQDKFWQVGFLTYYRDDHIIPCIIGIPSCVVAIISLKRSTSLGLDLSFWILLYVTVCLSNVQSSARFFASHPSFYLGVANFMIVKDKMTLLQRLGLLYFVLYNIFGIILFPIRYPWT